jgi:hypothetical protein
MKNNQMIVDKLMEIFDSQLTDPDKSEFGFEEKMLEKYADLANDVRSLVYDIEDSFPHKEVISIQPGDVIAISVPGALSEKACEHIKMSMAIAFPGSKSVILEEGMSLEVYREQVKDGNAR